MYAIAKIAGVKLCQAYRRLYGADRPINIDGPDDNHPREESHVIAALLGRYHNAKVDRAPQTAVWDTGTFHRALLFGQTSIVLS